MSTIFSVFVFSFKSMFRNFKSAGIMFILPIVFMGVFGIAFGGETNSLDINIGVYEQDSIDGLNIQDTFKNVTDNSERLELNTVDYNSIKALEEDIKEKEIDLGLVISSSETMRPQFEISSLDSNLNSPIYKSIVSDIVTPISLGREAPVTSKTISSTTNSLTGFDFLAPGLIIYGLIILIPGVAVQFVEIEEKKQVLRYANSKIKGVELIAGSVLYYLAIGFIQIILLYLTALAFGYQASGNIFIASIPAILSLFFAIAVGILIASVSSKTTAASNVGTIVSIILGFFSGSFISGIGRALEFSIAGYQLQFNDILPTKWGTEAVQKILTNNRGLNDIQSELLILLISGVITLSISVFIYSNRKLKLANAA